jgi:hypothetical protein
MNHFLEKFPDFPIDFAHSYEKLEALLEYLISETTKITSRTPELFGVLIELGDSVNCSFVVPQATDAPLSIALEGRLYVKIDRDFDTRLDLVVFLDQKRIVLIRDNQQRPNKKYLHYRYHFESSSWINMGWQDDDYGEYDMLTEFNSHSMKS